MRGHPGYRAGHSFGPAILKELNAPSKLHILPQCLLFMADTPRTCNSAALKREIQEINYKISSDIRIYGFGNLPRRYEFVMADQPPDATPVRESLRRSSRPVKRYGNIDPESDGTADSDPEFHLSDSDDDPDFNPVDKKVSKGG